MQIYFPARFVAGDGRRKSPRLLTLVIVDVDATWYGACALDRASDLSGFQVGDVLVMVPRDEDRCVTVRLDSLGAANATFTGIGPASAFWGGDGAAGGGGSAGAGGAVNG